MVSISESINNKEIDSESENENFDQTEEICA